jgi:signal transduction histidine kinase/ActR/RegA family two-component response regulator
MERSPYTSRIWKLVPAMALTVAVALLVVGMGMAAYNERAYRHQKADEAEVQAWIVASAVAAALAFEDRTAAREYVVALKANPEIQAAAVYDDEGSLFVAYSRAGRNPFPDRIQNPSPQPESDFVVVTVPVVQGEVTLGSVRLRVVAEPFVSRLERYGGIGLLVTMASLVVLVLGAAHAALSRVNAELRGQASALAEAYGKLQAETAERQKAEDALRQTQKMEAIGQLSGGVAHDFNNLLQAMAGCLRMIERRAAIPEIGPLIEAGRQAVDRGAKLTQQLMAFARSQALRPEPVDVADRLLGMSELLARALRADIELGLDLERGLWAVEVDPTQFELAVLNLAVNARDAMPGGGRLLIRGGNLSLAPGEDAQGLVGDYVRLVVSDTGTGMPPEVVARVFEPFFTTKGVGKGTGLGLSQVYGFSRQSGGTARVESVPGRGTSVSLLLPRCHAVPVRSAPEAVAAVGHGEGRRLLLVEDDPVVGTVMAAALEDLGYSVIRAFSADEALALLARGEPIQILFSDVVMPGALNGLDLAREVRRLRPDLPILLTSGYTEGATAGKEFRLLAKPYRIETLAEALIGVIRATQEEVSGRESSREAR